MTNIQRQKLNFNELKPVYGNASIVNNEKVVYNIKGNDFRLVALINFSQIACYFIWFVKHKEYIKINVKTRLYIQIPAYSKKVKSKTFFNL
ncbi:MAG: type II toxin-antitoxin system HigB family toxin [Bacteroidota bacterium]